VHALDHVVVRTADPEAAVALYGAGLGLRLALDRSFEDWGVRLLFFRIGGLTVEVAAALPSAAPEAGLGEADRDRLWGLSWRVGDVEAARARLAGAGFDVSPVRRGRKPGTRVCTVRGEPCGVATLLIGPEPP
jgi:catechol 2,3-dioxygenase-like lactoylglutathione lyase family enzyme